MKRYKSIVIIFFAVLFSIINCADVRAEVYFDLTAQTAILIEQTTGKILYAKDEHKRMYPASMTKILTALVAMDYLKPDEIIIIGDEITNIPWDSSKAGHEIGEAITVENLIRALIILSGNETGCVLALNVAKRVQSNSDITYDEAERVFCSLMNEKAKSLGAEESNFINPHGYHNEAHYSTAYDIAQLSVAFMENPVLRKIAGEKRFESNGGGDNPDPSLYTRDYNKDGHNFLLLNEDPEYYPYATGIKTGWSDEAEDCLAASAEKNGVKLISVVFYAPDPARWRDTRTLLDYGFNTYSFETVQTKGDIIEALPISNHKLGEPDTIEVYVPDEFSGFYSKEELLNIQKSITYNDEYIYVNEEDTSSQLKLKAPIEEGAVLGTITYSLNDTEEFHGDVLAFRGVEERTMSSDVEYYWDQFKKNIFTLKAIPFWVAGISVISLIIILISSRKRKRESNYYRLKRRY